MVIKWNCGGGLYNLISALLCFISTPCSAMSHLAHFAVTKVIKIDFIANLYSYDLHKVWKAKESKQKKAAVRS